MNIKSVLWILVLILLSSFAFAISDENGWAYYSFDDNYSDTSIAGYGRHLTAYDGASFTGGLIGNSFYTASSAHAMNQTVDNIDKIKTIDLWAYPDDSPHNERIMCIGGEYPTTWIQLNIEYGAAAFSAFDGSSWSDMVICSDGLIAGWNHVVFTMNDTAMMIYCDGVLEDTETANLINFKSSYNKISFGDCLGATQWSGRIDNVFIGNETYTQADVTASYNGGAGFNYTGTGTPATPTYTTVNVSDTLPEDNAQFKSNEINFSTIVNASYDFSCSLYVNDTLNLTQGFSSGQNVSVNITATIDEGIIEYYLSCNDSNTTTNTTAKIFIVDVSTPVIVDSYVNLQTTNILTDTDSIIGTWNITDNIVLYGLEVFIDDVQVENKTNLNTSLYYYNFTYPVSSLSKSQHTFSVSFYDGHTATELKNPKSYNPQTKWFDSEVRFDFVVPYKKGFLKMKKKGGSILDNWDLKESKDRFSFEFKPISKTTSHTFTIEADSKIDIIHVPDSEYKTWIVYDEHWLDFMPYDITNINRVSDTEVEVTVDGFDVNDEIYTFNSIGDLNVVSENYTFDVIGLNATYSTSVIETEEQTMEFEIYKINSSYSTQANLVYNNAIKSLNKFQGLIYDTYTVTFNTPMIDNASKQVDFTFNFNITNGGVTELSQDFNQTIIQIGISNCSNSSHATALTFKGYEELNPNKLVNYSLNIDLDVWVESESSFRDVSFGFNGNSSYDICIYPSESTYYVAATMEYDADNFVDRKYYLDAYELTNVSSIVNLYLINQTQRTEVILKVYDESTGLNVPNALIKVQRFYPEGNSSNSGGIYRTVEVEKTDVSGQTLGKLVLSDVYYRFIVEVDGIVKLTTTAAKVFTTTKVLPISLQTDWFETYKQVGDLSVSTGCNETTMVCNVEWNDASNVVNTISFDVYEHTAFGKSLIYSDEATSASGNIVYTIPTNTTGKSYVATSYLISNNDDASLIKLGIGTIDKTQKISEFGGVSTLFPVMLLTIGIASALLVQVGAIGIIIGCIIALLTLSVIGIIGLSMGNVMILMALGGILIAKMRQ